MRTHINKSLKTCCKAIQRALKRYNEAAASLGRPQLEWKDISTYDSLAEFELLQECREDIRRKPWADSANRQATVHTLKLERAHKERSCLNVEIAHLVDWMADEEVTLKATIARLQESHSPLAVEAEEYFARRSRQNLIHRKRIHQIYQLPHYTGPRNVAISCGLWAHPSVGSAEASDHSDDAIDLPITQDAIPDVEEDDLLCNELNMVNDFLGNLSIIDD